MHLHLEFFGRDFVIFHIVLGLRTYPLVWSAPPQVPPRFPERQVRQSINITVCVHFQSVFCVQLLPQGVN
jgi:hypothetical protein